jgi:hypothetical protein
MFGRYARAALAIPIAVVCAGILEYILPFFLPFMAKGGLLYRSFDWLGSNSLLLMLVAIAAGVLAGAAAESNPGVR